MSVPSEHAETMNTNETLGEEYFTSDGIQLKETDGTTLPDAFDLLHIDLELSRNVARENEELSCSRNVLRKQRNWERRLAAKKNKRKEEKERRKQRRAEVSVGDTGTAVDSLGHSKRVLKAVVKERLTQARTTGPKLCVDLSLTDVMSPKEISRLAGQIRRLYGSNRRAAKPFHLYLTDLSKDGPLYQECQRMNDGFLRYVIDVTEMSFLDLFPLDSIIYLTPDAEQALEYVDPEKVYVLGGLVDESIQKKITYLRAREDGVCSARLPIEEYMVKRENGKNFHSKVLSINQVFDILLTFCDTGSWTVALGTGVPLGKGYMVKPKTSPQLDNTEECHL